MNKIIVILTFIPWILYFFLLCKNSIKDLKEFGIDKTHIKENKQKIFHYENILLFIIFLYFSLYYYKSSQIWLVEVLLFFSSNLYLFFNKVTDKSNNDIEIGTKDVITIMIILFITLIPIMFYLITNRPVITYYILYLFSLLNYFIVMLSMKINIKIMKAVRKHNHEIQ